MSASTEHMENTPERYPETHLSSSPKQNSHFTKVLDKLRTDPLSITTEDARRLSEQVEVTDRRSAKIVSVVESLALASQDIQQLNTQTDSPSMAQAPRHAQHNLVNDLRAAVENYPNDVTPDLLKATQEIVTKMQHAVGATHAPNPELEDVLQKELARIEPKIEQGTVTKAEADHLHSLETRAHGHTEKGGVTAKAQSVAARRERALSLSESTNESHACLDNSNVSKGQYQTGATPELQAVAKSPAIRALAENVQNAPKVDPVHNNGSHTRQKSVVEAH